MMYFSIDFCIPVLGTNQNLNCWGNTGQSEDQKLICMGNAGQSEAQPLCTTGTAVTGFCTKPPIMPYSSEYSFIVLDNLRGSCNKETVNML